jgi:hypothetical protein
VRVAEQAQRHRVEHRMPAVVRDELGEHPATLEIAVTLEAPAPLRLLASLNGRPVGEAAVGIEPGVVRWKLPADALFRGDNELALEAVGSPAPAARLTAIEIRSAD